MNRPKMHWKLKLSWALIGIPLAVGAARSITAATPVPFIVAVFIVGVMFDGPIRDLRRSGWEGSE